MNFFVNTILAVLAFAAHVGLASATTTGVPIHVLAVLTIVCIWLQDTQSIGNRLLPAALLEDLIQPTRVPVTVLTVLAVWFVATMIQKHWLTNHSIASLVGLALIAALVRMGVTWLGIALSAAVGTSSIPVAASWNWYDNTLRFFIETSLVVGLGTLWRGLQRMLRRSFLYATH